MFWKSHNFRAEKKSFGWSSICQYAEDKIDLIGLTISRSQSIIWIIEVVLVVDLGRYRWMWLLDIYLNTHPGGKVTASVQTCDRSSVDESPWMTYLDWPRWVWAATAVGSFLLSVLPRSEGVKLRVASFIVRVAASRWFARERERGVAFWEGERLSEIWGGQIPNWISGASRICACRLFAALESRLDRDQSERRKQNNLITSRTSIRNTWKLERIEHSRTVLIHQNMRNKGRWS